MALSRLSVVLFVSAMGVALAATAQDEQRASGGQEVEFFWSGMRDNFNRIRSGSYRAVVVMKAYKQERMRYEYRSDIVAHFDLENDLFRFDRDKARVYPEALIIGEKQLPRLTKGYAGTVVPDKRRTWGTKYARDGIHSYSYEVDGRQAVIDKAATKPPAMAETFDIRALCLGFYGDIEAGTPYEQILKFWTAARSYKVTPEGNGVFRLDHVGHAGHVEYRKSLWLDASRGFAPVKIEVADRGPPSAGQAAWAEPRLRKAIEWDQRGEVWVPVKLKIDHVASRNTENSASVALTFDFTWDSVNKPIDASNFALEAFHLKDGTQVVDRTLGKPILVRIVGLTELPDFVRHIRKSPREPRAKLAPARIRLFLVLNLVLVAALAGWWWHAARARRKGAP